MENRYVKNILIPGFGESSQEKLLAAKACIIGLGGLGSIVSSYLVTSGIGNVMLIDPDKVELKNLQRQLLYSENDVECPKAEISLKKLSLMNSSVNIKTYAEYWEDIKDIIIENKPDVIVDCVDSIKTKFRINEFSVKNKIPFIHAGVVSMRGQVTTVIPGRTACIQCLFGKELPDETSSDKLGILGSAAGMLAAYQASEAVKLITGFGKLLENRILFIDIENNRFSLQDYVPSENCVCRS